MKQVDDVYNGSAAVGAIMAWIVDQTSGFNRNKGAVRLITTVFSGVGIGGTLAYCYLYYQGVYEEGFQYSDFNYADEQTSYASTSYEDDEGPETRQSAIGMGLHGDRTKMSLEREQEQEQADRAREKERTIERSRRDHRNRQFPYDPQTITRPVTLEQMVAGREGRDRD